MLAHATGQGRKIYEAVGAKRTVVSAVPPATHQMGTARMSHDPKDGVTDPYGRTHEVPNLTILDASVFVTSSVVNPTLTAQAHALRAADRLIAERHG